MKFSEVKVIINEIVKDFESNNLTEFEIELDDIHIKMKKQIVVDSNKIDKTDLVNHTEDSSSKNHHIKAPLIGTFYDSSSPNDPPFIKVGDSVVSGQTLCIIESMKVMNEITSPIEGVIKNIHKKNKEIVGFGDLLIEIEE